MRSLSFVVFCLHFLIMICAIPAEAAGVRIIEIPASAKGVAFKAIVWSPCALAPVDTKIGPFSIHAVRDCPIEGNKLPLIIVSHGYAGSAFSHHDTATELANAGFLVVALNHPGDSALDLSRSGDLSVLLERPLDISRLLDYLLVDFSEASKIDPEKIGMFGFSRGGYTALVVAGANPDFYNAKLPCPDPEAPLCRQIKNSETAHLVLAHDARVKAFVVADPLNAFPEATTLKNVRSPLQLWASEQGGEGVSQQSVIAIRDNLPVKPDFQLVPNATHYVFLAPCSTEMTSKFPQICKDSASFNRILFHASFNQNVREFFKKHLTANR